MTSRFEVDVKGMRELQGSRELWRLVKELPVNVFDEYAREDVAVRPTPTASTMRRESSCSKGAA